ncbi:MAG TPA: amidohydrolase family protein [Gaiellales bacterium]|nr:amidohydrolase family protein [Gaiellales bacterium]
MEELLIEGAAVLPAAGADWLESAAVLVREGRVAALGPADELRRTHPDAERTGGPDRLVMPGLVNAHQHAEGVSTAQLGFRDEPFEPWMVLMHSLPTVEPYLTTLYKSMLMLTSGVTTHVHSHFPAKGGYERSEAYLDELEHSLRAHREAGLRTAFAPYWRDRGTFTYDDDDLFAAALPGDLAGDVRRLTGTPISNAIYIEAITELASRLDGDPLIGVQLSIAAPQWASDDLLDAIGAAASDLGLQIHMHALESRRQRDWGDAARGGRELHHLAERGVLGEGTTIAHGVYLRDADIDLLAERRAMVAHNCSSNLRLACGLAPVRRLVARGVTVGLGSDDMAVSDDEDMLAEVRMAHVAQRIWEGPEPPLGAADVLRLAWEGGARIAGLEGSVGRLEPGYLADAVVLDLGAVRGVFASPRLAYDDLVVARAGRGHVREVVVGGRVLVRDGAPVHVDMDALAAEVAEAARAVDAGRDPARQAFLERLRPWALRHPPAL